MNVETSYKRKKSLIAAHIVGVGFGLIFAATNEYQGFWEIIGAWTLGPIAFAALFRFCVRAYQLGKRNLGVKVGSPEGGCVIIERPRRGFLAAVIAFFLPVAVVSVFAGVSQTLVVIVTVVLLAVGVFFCYLDIKFMVRYKRENRTN